MDLLNQLVAAIESNKGIEGILQNKNIQDVLNMWKKAHNNSKISDHTILVCAIRHGNKKAVEDILNIKDESALKRLFPRDFPVLDYANKLKELYLNNNNHGGNNEFIKNLEYLITIIKEKKRELENVPTVEGVEAGNGTTVPKSIIDGYDSDSSDITVLSSSSQAHGEETPLPQNNNSQGSSSVVGGGSGNGEVGGMKSYNSLLSESYGKIKCALFNMLTQKIKTNDNIGLEDTLKNVGIQEVLNVWKVESPAENKTICGTVLTDAIHNNNITAARAILQIANHNNLKKLLEVKQTIKSEGSTTQISALNYAQAKRDQFTSQNQNGENDVLIQDCESLIKEIEEEEQKLGVDTITKGAVDMPGWRELPFHPQETVPAPAMVVGSGNGIDKNALFDELVNAIKNGDCIKHILEKSCVQDVLGSLEFDDGKGNTHTVLTYAIDCGNMVAANGILAFNTTSDKVTEAVLISLLMEELEVKDEAGKTEKYMAFSYAEKKGHTELAQRIKQKMDDLGISIPGESAVNNTIKFRALQPLPNQRAKAQGVQQPSARRENNALPHNHGKAGDSGNSSGMEGIQDNSRKGDQAKVADHSGKDGKPHTSLNSDNGSEKGNEKFPNSIANDLFFAVLKGDSKHANGLLNQYKGDPAIFQSGWMQILLIGDEQARELTTKDNKNIIKEIQERQAMGVGIVGGVIAVSAIVAIAAIILTASIPMTPGAITGIVAAGILGLAGLFGVFFACEPKEVPDTAMDKTANENVKLQPSAVLPT